MRKFVLQSKFTNYTTNSFKRYLNDIQSIKPLSVEEEKELIITLEKSKYKQKILDKLVLHNLRFVISVAKQYVSPDNLLEDLVNEGNLGLIEASKRFDPTLGIRFFSYAVWWIRRSMTMYSTNNKIIRIPHNKNFSLMKIQEYVENFIQKNGRPCNENELVDANFELNDINDYFIIDSFKSSSMDSSIKLDEDDFDGVVSDSIESDYYGADERLINDDLKYKINCLLQTIKKEKERKIIIKLFGLNGSEVMSIQSVAHIMEMTTERIRQIKESNLKKMNKFYKILE